MERKTKEPRNLVAWGSTAVLGCMLSLLASGLGASALAQESKPKPTFFEEERRLSIPTSAERQQSRQVRSKPGFGNTFLSDALGGVSDPLSGSGWAGNNPGFTDDSISEGSLGIFQSLPPSDPPGGSGIFRSLPSPE